MSAVFFAQETADISVPEYKSLEQQILLNSSGTEDVSGTTSPSSDTNLFFPFLRTIFVLAVVIAIIYLIAWFFKKSITPGAENDLFLKKTASITLAPGKTVQIVTFQDKAYMLGVSDNSITLLSEINDKELVDTMNLQADSTNVSRPRDFASLLGAVSSSAKKTENFLKKKRENIGKNGENK